MKTISEYRKQGRESLRGNWTPAVLATLVLFIIAFAISGTNPSIYQMNVSDAWMILTCIAMYFIGMPLSYGYANAIRALCSKGDRNVTSNMIHMPLAHYFDVAWTMFYMAVKIVLWSLLLFVPGIIKSFSYAMTPFVLEEEPELSAGEAIAKSARMMQGHKMQLFLLELSFMGWIFLSFFTLGIGVLWIEPYIYASMSAFYDDVKAEFEQRS